MQGIVGVIFLLVSIGIAAVFIWVALSTRRKEDYAKVLSGLTRARKIWAAVLAAILITLLSFSLATLPYPWAAGVEVPEQVVEVNGFQFGWQVTPQQLKPGVVEFRVVGADVNHSFGVYSPQGKLLGQTQAMPGYTNRLRLRLEDRGTYIVRCLEFCGVGHHVMMATFEVR